MVNNQTQLTIILNYHNVFENERFITQIFRETLKHHFTVIHQLIKFNIIANAKSIALKSIGAGKSVDAFTILI